MEKQYNLLQSPQPTSNELHQGFCGTHQAPEGPVQDQYLVNQAFRIEGKSSAYDPERLRQICDFNSPDAKNFINDIAPRQQLNAFGNPSWYMSPEGPVQLHKEVNPEQNLVEAKREELFSPPQKSVKQNNTGQQTGSNIQPKPSPSTASSSLSATDKNSDEQGQVGYEIVREIGSGAFSVIYEVIDYSKNCNFAIKMERPDKARSILISEYDHLLKMQGRNNMIQVIDFVSQEHQGFPNFIVMDLLGENLCSFRHRVGGFVPDLAFTLLRQMLTAIETTHKSGLIHRDIKPANFLMGRQGTPQQGKVYLADFGLAKIHLDQCGNVLPPRRRTDFRGTIPYASLSAHLKFELGRKDDLWSFFFILLEFLNQELPWAGIAEQEKVKELKLQSICEPVKLLYPNLIKTRPKVHELFCYILQLEQHDAPDYSYLHRLLAEMSGHSAVVCQTSSQIQQQSHQEQSEEPQSISNQNYVSSNHNLASSKDSQVPHQHMSPAKCQLPDQNTNIDRLAGKRRHHSGSHDNYQQENNNIFLSGQQNEEVATYPQQWWSMREENRPKDMRLQGGNFSTKTYPSASESKLKQKIKFIQKSQKNQERNLFKQMQSDINVIQFQERQRQQIYNEIKPFSLSISKVEDKNEKISTVQAQPKSQSIRKRQQKASSKQINAD